MINGKWKGHSLLDYNDCKNLEEMKQLFRKRHYNFEYVIATLDTDNQFYILYDATVNADNVDDFLKNVCLTLLESLNVDLEEFRRKMREDAIILENGHLWKKEDFSTNN